MGINNINMLQHSEDVAYLTSNTSNNYYIHALANMGQRLGVYDDTAIRYNILKYANDLNESIEISEVFPDIFEFSTDLTFEISINNIETYKRKSQVINDGVQFKMLLFGKLLGTDDEDENNIEIQYTDIDIEQNIILEAWRAFYLKNDVYIILHLTHNQTTYNSHEYELKTYKCFIDRSQTDIRSCFTSSTYDAVNINEHELSNILADLKVDKIGPDYGFFYKLIYGEDNQSYNNRTLGYSVYTESVINNNYTLKLSYDTLGDTSEQYIKITDSSALSRSYENVHDVLYFDVYGIDKRVHILNIDFIKIYLNILKYFSETRFNLNNTKLKEILIHAIYNELYNEYYVNRIINEAGEVDNKIPKLIVNPDFEITYLSKVDNALKIYYTNDIYVNFRNFDDVDEETFPLTFKYNGNNKVSVYNISVNYNSHYPDFIDNIEVIKKYTLPYINDSKFWVINDMETNNSAIGENAGNPNIMILKTSIENGTISHHILNRFDIYDEDLQYEELYDSDLKDKDGNRYKFYVPKIQYGNTLLKYANLIIISDVVSDSSISSHVKISDPITTLWTINSDSNKFVMVMDNNNEPITLNALMSMDTYLFNGLNNYNSSNNSFNDLIALKVYNNLLTQDTLSANEQDGYRLLTLSSKKNSDFSNPEERFNYNHIYWQLNTTAQYSDPYRIHMTYTIFNDKTKYIELNKTTSTPYSYGINIINEIQLPTTMIGERLSTEYGVILPSNHNSNNSNNSNNNNNINNISDNTQYAPGASSAAFGQQATIATPSNVSIIDLYADAINNSNSDATMTEISNTVITVDNDDLHDSLPITNVIESAGQMIYITPKDVPIDLSVDGYYNEYVPTAYVPMMDTAELLNVNHNIINRTNIISFDKNNNMYYSYFGTSFNDNDKSTLYIGTSNTNINVGTETLFKSNSQFKKHEKLDITFSYVNINSDTTNINGLIINGNNEQKTKTIEISSMPSKFFVIHGNENSNTPYQPFDGLYIEQNRCNELLNYFCNLFGVKLSSNFYNKIKDSNLSSGGSYLSRYYYGKYENNEMLPPKSISGFYADKFIIFNEPLSITLYPRTIKDKNDKETEEMWLYTKLFY